jgi:hypothetical protein
VKRLLLTVVAVAPMMKLKKLLNELEQPVE